MLEREFLNETEELLLASPAKTPVDPIIHNQIIDELLNRLVRERKKNRLIENFNAKETV